MDDSQGRWPGKTGAESCVVSAPPHVWASRIRWNPAFIPIFLPRALPREPAGPSHPYVTFAPLTRESANDTETGEAHSSRNGWTTSRTTPTCDTPTSPTCRRTFEVSAEAGKPRVTIAFHSILYPRYSLGQDSNMALGGEREWRSEPPAASPDPFSLLPRRKRTIFLLVISKGLTSSRPRFAKANGDRVPGLGGRTGL